ncbi:helix-turn-helix domain-containing protein [Spirochaeta dissipatitropha]
MNADKTLGQALLGKNVKKYRSFLKLTQSQLAEKCEVSVNFISEIEGGKAWVSAESLDKLVRALGVSHERLFQDDSEGETGIIDTEQQLDQLEKNLNNAVRQLRLGYLGKSDTDT